MAQGLDIYVYLIGTSLVQLLQSTFFLPAVALVMYLTYVCEVASGLIKQLIDPGLIHPGSSSSLDVCLGKSPWSSRLPKAARELDRPWT